MIRYSRWVVLRRPASWARACLGGTVLAVRPSLSPQRPLLAQLIELRRGPDLVPCGRANVAHGVSFWFQLSPARPPSASSCFQSVEVTHPSEFVQGLDGLGKSLQLPSPWSFITFGEGTSSFKGAFKSPIFSVSSPRSLSNFHDRHFHGYRKN